MKKQHDKANDKASDQSSDLAPFYCFIVFSCTLSRYSSTIRANSPLKPFRESVATVSEAGTGQTINPWIILQRKTYENLVAASNMFL